MRDHSLSLFLLVTGIGWVVDVFAHGPQREVGPGGRQYRLGMDRDFGLVILTKHMIERHSKESQK